MKLSRRTLLRGAVAAAPLPARQAAAAQRPNVIVILFDDLGVHDLGFLGASDLRTPHIDRLASSGTVCRNWYSNAPVCAPARSALMTGRNPLRAGVPDNGRALRPTEKTIASLLKENGYETGLIGKWHLGSSADTIPNAHGFDYFYGFHEGCVDYYSHRYYWGEPKRANFHDLWRNRQEIFEDGRYLTERIGEEAAAFIDRQRERPFFLYTAFNAVHYPMHAPQQYVERFPNLPPERRMYAAMLAAADDRVGDMVAALARTGQRDRTLIFLIGDNGATTERRAGLNQEIAMAGRNTPFRGFKFSAFDGGMHVPALVNWPGHIPAGRRIDQIVMTADILPTVVSLAGAKLPSDRTFDGRNIWPVLTENAPSPNPYVAWAQGPQLAIRKGKWKAGTQRRHPRWHARRSEASRRRRRRLSVGSRSGSPRIPQSQTTASGNCRRVTDTSFRVACRCGIQLVQCLFQPGDHLPLPVLHLGIAPIAHSVPAALDRE